MDLIEINYHAWINMPKETELYQNSCDAAKARQPAGVSRNTLNPVLSDHIPYIGYETTIHWVWHHTLGTERP